MSRSFPMSGTKVIRALTSCAYHPLCLRAQANLVGMTQTRTSMDLSSHSQPRLLTALSEWWKDNVSRLGVLSASRTVAVEIWRFLLESTPEKRRRRYGDVDYDWEYRVDTTSATVGWRDRFLGALHSPYQPTEPVLFHEMVGRLGIDFSEFTFIDLGSGKGRALLMAAEYPFRRIIGVELLPELNAIAQENLRRFNSEKRKCLNVETQCGDARQFVFPPAPTVLYLFNPSCLPDFDKC